MIDATLSHALSHFLGQDNLSGGFYGAWSGWVSDVTIPATMAVGMFTFLRRHNCHARWCWRMGHHEVTVDGVTWKVCRHHHPRLSRRPPLASHFLRALHPLRPLHR